MRGGTECPVPGSLVGRFDPSDFVNLPYSHWGFMRDKLVIKASCIPEANGCHFSMAYSLRVALEITVRFILDFRLKTSIYSDLNYCFYIIDLLGYYLCFPIVDLKIHASLPSTPIRLTQPGFIENLVCTITVNMRLNQV